MTNIRAAKISDDSRIAEMIVTNYRINFFHIFKNEDYYFGELNVLDMASEYADNPDILANTYVYDDGVVKGMFRVNEDELVKLFVEPAFQSQGIGGVLLNYAVNELNVSWLWALEYNTRGIEFYKRNGFRFSGEKMLEDGWIPVLKLTKQSSED